MGTRLTKTWTAEINAKTHPVTCEMRKIISLVFLDREVSISKTMETDRTSRLYKKKFIIDPAPSRFHWGRRRVLIQGPGFQPRSALALLCSANIPAILHSADKTLTG